MLTLILLIAFAVFAFRSTYYTTQGELDVPDAVGLKLGRLWEIAHQGMRDNKLLRAEKALLTILKIDEKNAAAYNRLGILYAKQKEYKDAIDCFEIASSIEPSASSLHNLGLIYYETANFEKAAIAFEESLKLEDELAARHIAYAKVQEKLGNDKKMIQELERAAELEPNNETFSLLLRAYEVHDMPDAATAIKRKMSRTISSSTKPKRISRPPRVVV